MPAMPGMLAKPPRSLTIWRTLALLDAGLHGRPILRYASMALLSGLLALAIALPDQLSRSLPTAELKVVSARQRTLPGPLAGLGASIPGSVMGYEVSYRLPDGQVQRGPISGGEFAAIRAGQETLHVHLTGGSTRWGRPNSGLFAPSRKGSMILCCLVAVGFLLLLLRRLRSQVWLVKLARNGVEITGRVKEMKNLRLVRGDKPVGRVFTLYYDFLLDGKNREGVIKDFRTAHHHPVAVGRTLRILVEKDPPHRSIPAELLPMTTTGK